MPRLSLLLGALFPLLAGALIAQNASGPSARAARISYLSGNVSFQPSGDTDWSLATLNYPMTTGDRLFADRGGRLELQVGPMAVRLAEASDLTVTNLSDQLVQLGLTQGTMRVSVYQLYPGDTVEVDTPYGALTLLAPGDYRVDAPAGEAAMVVTVERGSLEWTAGGVAQTVQDGQAIRVSGIDPIQVTSVSPAPADGFEQWSLERDNRLASSPSAQYVSRDIPGYDDLDNAGTWQQEAEYGPVWYPSGVPGDWAPYRNGHWVWVEPWGWTWVEHEPWGYAPFHYGRWVFARSRWGWLPGPVAVRSYYAPALVVFINGSSFGAQAWFPLGPGETYSPWYHHDDDYFRRVNVTNMRNVTNITVVANINTINYRNRERATTAVPTAVFQGGQPVAGRTMPMRAADIARAPILPHPVALPSARAAAGGAPAPRPPEVQRPVFVPTRTPQAAPSVRPNEPLVVPRTEPTPRAAPVVITRHPAPPPAVPFPARQRAMKPDAGRPLEPQQIDSLRAGKPVGPRRDPENPPHAAAARPAPKPAAPAPAAPAPRRAAPARNAPTPNPVAPAPRGAAPTLSPVAPSPAAPAPTRAAPARHAPTPNPVAPAPRGAAPTPKPNAPAPKHAAPTPKRTAPGRPAPKPDSARGPRN